MLGGWPVPVSPGAKRPTVFRLPFRATWDAPSWRTIGRLSGPTLRGRFGRNLRNKWGQLALRKVLPYARRNLRVRYHWTGKAAGSLRVMDHGAAQGKVHISLGTDLAAERGFGKWADTDFIYPTGLHEGIKRHKVFIRYGGRERKELKRWALAHGFRDPGPTRNWVITVYSKGRRQTAWPFLWGAVTANQTRFADTLADALDTAIWGRLP